MKNRDSVNTDEPVKTFYKTVPISGRLSSGRGLASLGRPPQKNSIRRLRRFHRLNRQVMADERTYKIISKLLVSEQVSC